MIQHLSDPSRVTLNTATLIDHVLTSPHTAVSFVQQSVGVSDHMVQVIGVDMLVSRPLPSRVSVRSFQRCDWSEVRRSIAYIPWQVMDTFDDVNDMWCFFQSSLLSILNDFAPLKLVSSTHSKRPTPWMTPDILTAIKNKHSAKRRATKSHDPKDIAYYKFLKNKLKVSIREAKLSYLNSLLQKSKSNPSTAGDLWSGLNMLIGRQRRKCDGIDSELSLDFMNNFFCDIAVTSNHQPATAFKSDIAKGDTSFQFGVIHPQDVEVALQHLDVQKSTGPDGFSARFLREVAAEVAIPLTKLYNVSLCTGTVPTEWKNVIFHLFTRVVRTMIHPTFVPFQ